MATAGSLQKALRFPHQSCAAQNTFAEKQKSTAQQPIQWLCSQRIITSQPLSRSTSVTIARCFTFAILIASIKWHTPPPPVVCKSTNPLLRGFNCQTTHQWPRLRHKFRRQRPPSAGRRMAEPSQLFQNVFLETGHPLFPFFFSCRPSISSTLAPASKPRKMVRRPSSFFFFKKKKNRRRTLTSRLTHKIRNSTFTTSNWFFVPGVRLAPVTRSKKKNRVPETRTGTTTKRVVGSRWILHVQRFK